MSPPRAFSFVERAESIARHDPCRFHVHESVFTKMLGFSSGAELDAFISRLAAGGAGGNPKSASWEANPSPYNCKIKFRDLTADNKLNLHCETFGQTKETFYTFGCRTDGNQVIPLRTQLEVAQKAIGIHKSLDRVTAQRRREQWRQFFVAEGGGEDYRRADLPVLADEYGELLGIDVGVAAESSNEDECEIPTEALAKIKEELVTILRFSFFSGR